MFKKIGVDPNVFLYSSFGIGEYVWSDVIERRLNISIFVNSIIYFICEHKKAKEECCQFSVLCVSKCGTFIVGLCILDIQVKNYAVIFRLLSNFLLQVLNELRRKRICSLLYLVLGDKAPT